MMYSLRMSIGVLIWSIEYSLVRCLTCRISHLLYNSALLNNGLNQTYNLGCVHQHETPYFRDFIIIDCLLVF